MNIRDEHIFRNASGAFEAPDTLEPDKERYSVFRFFPFG